LRLFSLTITVLRMLNRNYKRFLLLVLITAAVWWPVFEMPLLQDDFVFLAKQSFFLPGDPRLPKVAQFPACLWAPRRNTAYWRPLSQNIWLNQTMRWQVWPSERLPLLGHAISLCLFSTCIWLVFLLNKSFWRRFAESNEHVELTAFLGAAVFASRPIWFLGVAWISAQQELIGFILALCSALAILRLRYALAGGLFFLALLSKETTLIILPLIPALLWASGNAKQNIRGATITFGSALMVYLAIRIFFVIPWQERPVLPTPFGVIRNLSMCILMLLDINREVLRVWALHGTFKLRAAMTLPVLIGPVVWIYLAYRCLGKPNFSKEERKAVLVAICLIMAAMVAPSLSPSPYGYYLLYAGLFLSFIAGWILCRLSNCVRRRVLLLLISAGIVGVWVQRLSPQGNFQRAFHASHYRAYLRRQTAPSGTKRVIICGYDNDEIWAMGWGLGLELPVRGGKPLPYDRRQVVFEPSAPIPDRTKSEMRSSPQFIFLANAN